MKIWKKWSYLLILFLCGAVTMTVTESWNAAAQPAQTAGEKLLAMGDSYKSVMGKSIQAVNTLPPGESALASDGNALSSGDGVLAPEDGKGTAGNTADNTVGEASQGNENGDRGNGEGEEPYEVTWRDPSEVVYTAVEDDYFSDAVFIGDSRTVGMFEYGGLEEISTFYASTGLTVYSLFGSEIVQMPGQREKISIEQALEEIQFGKIYLMVGINEMGRGTLDDFLDQYAQVVDHLRELQPDAIIYLQGIIKVTTARSAKGDYITNQGIEERNAGIAALADQIQVYYLDVNPVICDENGGMEASYTTDGVHLMAQYIPIWKEFLKEHAVVLD